MIIVLGQPRSGTTLLMQMLHAAGIDCLGEWPAFEHDAFMFPPFDFTGVDERQAVKALWSEPFDLPAGARVIVTTRDTTEQARSEWKFVHLVAFGRRPPKFVASERKRWAARSRRTQEAILAATRDHPRLIVPFDTVVRDARAQAERVAHFIGFGDAERMAGVVRSRSPRCYPGLLEAELLNGRK